MNRPQQLQFLSDSERIWDIAIIGGGSSGFGVALDALSRGLSVILVDKSDFGKGTSSRSTKLLHGGVRYLAQGHIGLVLEALRERGRLLENAPHLTQNQTFVIPLYTWFDRLQYAVGLKIYDWMAGSLRLGKSRLINPTETLARLPNIKSDGLMGGVLYQDGQFDDARMIVALAHTCSDMGGCVLNYARVTSLLKNEQSKVEGIRVKDMTTLIKYKVRARMVVNATGVFADKILRMDHPEAERSIQPSQGIHLVFDREFLGGSDALLIPKTRDGRVLFAVPWHDKLVVGTTDTLRTKPKLEPEALVREVDFILETAGEYLAKTPTRADVRSVFAGLRPLAAPQKGSTTTKEISRSHKVIISDSNLVSITGGKWTTFRKMGEDTVAVYPRITGRALPTGDSSRIRLHGHIHQPSPGHLRVYGSDADAIKALAAKEPTLQVRIHPNHPYTAAEVVWMLRNEMVVTLEDMLSRRLRLLLLDAVAAKEVAPTVAKLMAIEWGLDQSWIEEEVQRFNKIANRYIIQPTHESKLYPRT